MKDKIYEFILSAPESCVWFHYVLLLHFRVLNECYNGQFFINTCICENCNFDKKKILPVFKTGFLITFFIQKQASSALLTFCCKPPF